MIEETIQDVAAGTVASSGDNLTGFEIDLDHALFQAGLAEDARIIRSDDDVSMLNVSIALPASFGSIAQVSLALAEVLMVIAYDTFHAAAFAYYRDAAILRFVTAVPSQGLRVTGTILVHGTSYEKLAEKDRPGVPPMPGGLPGWVV